jgi:catechol 2,3-dioxygenase-like lactoylglutathione lyase family enzyme
MSEDAAVPSVHGHGCGPPLLKETALFITGLDHLVMTCSDVDRTADWYTRVLELPVITYGQGRRALLVGPQKINLRPAEGSEDWVTGATSVPGDQDLCFLTEQSPQQVMQRLEELGVQVTNGPVTRDGARGTINSVYCLDPDGSLVEISSYA